MEAVKSANVEFPIVTHDRESVYTIFSVPDYIAGSYGCKYRLAGGELLPAPEKPAFGNYYALGFKTKTFTGEPAVLFTLWGRKSGEWKVVSFHIERP